MPSKSKKASKVALATTLARSDQECLLSELEALQNESKVTVSTKVEIQAVCGHLQNVVSNAKAWNSLALQLLIQLLKVLPVDFTEQLAKVVLDSSLLQLMSQAFDKLIRPLKEGASNTQLEHALMVLLQSLEDLSRSQYKGPGKQGMVSGKDKCGAQFVKRVATLAISNAASITQRRRCVQLLLELTTRSSSNRELLFGHQQGCKQLFGHVLASCGDYSTQADTMEVLYRAAKQDSLQDASNAFQGLPKVQSVFEYLVAKPLKEIESVGLDLEIRQLVKAYNSALGTAASVHPFKATGISIGGSKVVRAEEGNWVDVGKQHISLTIIVPELPSDANSEDPPPDLLDLHYSNIAGMDSKALPGNDSRYVQLKLCLKDTPDILLDHFGNDNKPLVVSLTFRKVNSDKLTGVIKKFAPQLVKPATGRPVNDSQDSFFELTQRPEPRVKMSMTMQTLSFRPTTTANGAPPGAQKATLDLQPSAHKARPSSATVQQQRSGPAQGEPGLAAKTHAFPGVSRSSRQQSKENGTLAAARLQHSGPVQDPVALEEDTARSPADEQQGHRVEGRQSDSQRSDSSSDPSEEVLDDPTNIALSQRPPAHLQQGVTLPPHGDPLLQTGQPERQQPQGSDAPLPVRAVPSKQGERLKKQGSVQSTVPQQNGSVSSAQRIQDHSKGPSITLQAKMQLPQAHLQPQPQSLPYDYQHDGMPAQSSRAQGQTTLRQPHSQRQVLPQKDQQSGLAQSIGAGPLHQPHALPQDQPHLRSSPLYAASEGEDSESESSAGNIAQLCQQQAPQGITPKQAVPNRAASAHTLSAGNAAVSGQGQAAKQDKVRLSQPIARQTRAHRGQASRTNKPSTGRAQGRAQVTAPARHIEAKRGRKSIGEVDDQEGFGLLSEDEQQSVGQTKIAQSKPGNSQASNQAQQDNVMGTKLVEQEAPELMNQATALQDAPALNDSAQDPEWLAIAQNVPDSRQMQAGADKEALEPTAVDHANTGYLQQQTDRQPAPEQQRPKQCRLFLEDDSEGESDSAQAIITGKRQKYSKQQQAKTAKQGKSSEMQGQQPGRGRQGLDEEALEDSNDVPSTYNNMPLIQKQHPMHDGYANQNFVPEDKDASPVAAAKQQKPKGIKQLPRKQDAAQVIVAELEFDTSDTESDDYEPTQMKAAAKATARRAAQQAAQAKGLKKPQRPNQDKLQGNARHPCKTARNAADEGHVKRPRGRPRKALPKQEQQPRQCSKRKAATTLDEEEAADQNYSEATVKPKAGKGDRLKKIALMPAAAEAEDQGAEALQEQDDLMLPNFDDHDAPAPQPPANPSLQPKGTTHKLLPSGQAPFTSQLGGKRQQAVRAAEDDMKAFTFAPAVDLSVGKRNVGQTAPLSAKKHTAKLPFSFPLAIRAADGPEQQVDAHSEDEVEVDLDLQQALAQSIRPSPAKMHTKGNALQDISNWRLPTSAKGQGAARSSPLHALVEAAGNQQQQQQRRKPEDDSFEIYQDKVESKKTGASGRAAKGTAIAGLPGTGAVKQIKPKAAKARATKASTTLSEASDSEEEGGAGASIKGVLQQMMQQGTNSQEGDSDDEGSGMADLQIVLQKVVSSKKASARQKQAEIIQGVQDHIDGLAAELGKSLKKELHESSAVCQAQFAELCKQLADKKAQITAKTEVYQQEVQVLWEGYKETYAMLEPMRQALAEYIQEKNAGHKRKLAELQSEGERLMADAERKLAKTQSKAAKLPALAKMLKAFV